MLFFGVVCFWLVMLMGLDEALHLDVLFFIFRVGFCFRTDVLDWDVFLLVRFLHFDVDVLGLEFF